MHGRDRMPEAVADAVSWQGEAVRMRMGPLGPDIRTRVGRRRRRRRGLGWTLLQAEWVKESHPPIVGGAGCGRWVHWGAGSV